MDLVQCQLHIGAEAKKKKDHVVELAKQDTGKSEMWAEIPF